VEDHRSYHAQGVLVPKESMSTQWPVYRVANVVFGPPYDVYMAYIIGKIKNNYN
jgi:hypothetical protein